MYCRLTFSQTTKQRHELVTPYGQQSHRDELIKNIDTENDPTDTENDPTDTENDPNNTEKDPTQALDSIFRDTVNVATVVV